MSSTSHPLDSSLSRKPMHKALLPTMLFITFACIVILSVVLLTSDDRPVANAGGEDGVLGGEFILQSADGEVALSDFKGKVVVMYFGFLSCPEVCPSSMRMMSSALDKMNQEERDEVQPILISIDPARDTLNKLKEATEFYNPKIIGVTGSQHQIESVAANYGAYFKVSDEQPLDTEYVFDHTSRYYIINSNGKLVDAMRHSTTANELVARIRTLIGGA